MGSRIDQADAVAAFSEMDLSNAALRLGLIAGRLAAPQKADGR